MSKFKDITNQELVDELYERGLVEDALTEIDDDDLVQMVRDRNLVQCFEDDFYDGGDDDDEISEEELLKDLKKTNYIIPKEFDRFQLRDHLIDISRLHSHASDEKLFNVLRDLLEFS